MKKRMKLQCQVRLNNDRTLTAIIGMYDGTPCEVVVDHYDIVVNEAFQHDLMTVDGWVIVQREAVQGDRAYLTLPKPSIQYGHQITVNTAGLYPVDVTLEDFNPETR